MNNILLKSENAITFCMHTEKMHIFYLKECEQSKHLIVIEEDLLTNGLVSTFVVPKGRNIEATGYILQFYKKSGFLMLSYPPCRFVIWDVNTQETILFTETRGKNPYFINNFTFNDSSRVLFFSAVGQRNIYCSPLVEDNNNFSFSKNTKLQLPKKIIVHDLKCQPNDKRLLAACSDGIIRIWNSGSLSLLKGLSDPQNQSNEMIAEANGEIVHKFSIDGQKLLAGTNYGQIYCFDSRSLGNKHLTLASINVGNSAILSCKWLYYNGLSSSKNQHFIAYTSQISLQLFKYSFQGSLPSLTTSKILPSVSQAKASASITKLQDLYNQRQEIKIQEFYGINLQFEKFLQIHEFANLFAFNTFKMKGQFSQQNRHSFKHTIKLSALYDKLYDKIDFPLVSPQFNHSFEQLLPSDKKQVFFQRQSFSVESMDVKMVSVVQGTIKTVASLKQILMSDDVKFYGIDARPLQMDYVGTMKYLLFYKMDDHYYTTSFCVNIERSEEEAKKEDSIEKYLATQSYQAIFLGESHYNNPPIFYLDENMQSFAIDCHLDKIDENISNILQHSGYSISDDELSVKGDLSLKIERIFSTPFQKGFVILYLIAEENRLCFSRNRLPGYRLLDFELGLPNNNISVGNTNSLVFRADIEDTIIDVIWQNMNTDNPSVQIGAVVCLNKIYFINGNLQRIRTVKVCIETSSNLISSAKWFGSALFYITRTHVHYVCIDGTTNSILSLDNYENKQCIAQIMIDRIVIASKSSIKKKQQQSQVEFKTKVFSPVEPLICGYIANCKYLKREIKEREISQIIEIYQTGNISPTLIQCLQRERLHHLCYFYIYNSENKQFPCGQKVEILEQMLKTEGILDLIFPNKSLNKETDIIEILKRLQTDPRAVGEFQSLQYLCQYYLLIGEFERALLVCHLLQDFRKMFIISKATNIQPLMDVFATNFLNTKIGCNIHKYERYILKQAISEGEQGSVNQTDSCIESFQTTDNFSYNIINSIESSGKSVRNNDVLQEIAELDEDLAQYMRKVINRKDTQQSSIVFGQVLYNQVFIDKPDEDEDDNHQNIQNVEQLHFENMLGYLGVYSTFIEASKTRQGGQNANAGGFGQQGGNEDMGGEAGGEEEEDQDENKDILILWRFDEGKGKQIGDLSNYEIEGELISDVGQYDKVWNQLEEGNPLEIEDIWGKKVPPQFSLVFNGDNIFNGVKTTSEKWCNKQKKIKEFTLELWIKAKGGEGSVFKAMNQNETSFEIRIKQYELQVLVKSTPIKFVAYKEEEDENNQSGNPKPNAPLAAGGNSTIQLQPNIWTHLSIQYEDSSKLSLFLNCKELFSSEDDLDLITYEAFKGKGLYIGSNTFKGEITEFRLRKEKLQVSQIRDQYKTPLPIVSEKKKKITFKVKKGDNQEDNKPKNQFNFAMPPIMEDNMNQFNTNAFNSTNQEDANKQPSKPANPFAFGMPPIMPDDIPASIQQPQAVDQLQKGSANTQQPKNPFAFSMPQIIKDDEYEIKNNQDEEEQKSSSSKKTPSQSNLDHKQNNSIDQKPAQNFDDFTAFGTFTQTPQVNKNRSDSNAFSQFQSYSGAQSSAQHKEFVDPFSQFSTQSKPQGKNDSFSQFGNDPTSAFGMFGAPQGNEGTKGGINSTFDGFKQTPQQDANEFNSNNNNNFFSGFGSAQGGQNNSFSNFGEQQNKK